jgi:hypothetical protein
METKLPIIDRSKLKGRLDRYLLKSLFYEYRFERGPSDRGTGKQNDYVYTLSDEDHENGTPSLYKIYMAMEDITEYEFANYCFTGWEHWTTLCNCSWFKPYINRWRTELELKLKAQAIRRIRDEAEFGGKNSYQANKWVVDRGWIEGDRKGRPTKQQIKEEAAARAAEINRIEEDLKRLESLTPEPAISAKALN